MWDFSCSGGLYLHQKERLMIDRFLRPEETARALKTLQKLSHLDISGWVLAGGFAVEIHCLRGRRPASIRQLNDFDFVVAAFDCIP